MNQSSFIAAFLLAGFVLWLAANNRLSAYAAVLWGTPTSATGSSTSPPATVTGSPLGPIGDAIGNWLTQNTGATSTDQQSAGSGAVWTLKNKDGTSTSVPSPGANPISSIGNTVSSAIGSVDAISTIAGFFGL